MAANIKKKTVSISAKEKRYEGNPISSVLKFYRGSKAFVISRMRVHVAESLVKIEVICKLLSIASAACLEFKIQGGHN